MKSSANSRHMRRLVVTLAATSSVTAGTLTVNALTTSAQAVPKSDFTTLACTSIPSTADPNVLEKVYRVGIGLHVTDRVMLAGFEAGWVESHMNNLPCGDADSLGVFQQRPSQGWGTPEQIMDVNYAANSFFSRAIPIAANNPGYTAGQIAQAVQRSAYPSRYDQAESIARSLMDQAKQMVNGKATVGYYQSSTGTWNLKDSHSGGTPDHSFTFGPAGMVPVAGDWNGDGKTTVGYYQPSNGTWHLKDTHSGGSSDYAFTFGPPNMIPIAGDWNNDGKTTVGYYQPSNGTWHLKNSNSGGAADINFTFGPANMVPVAGDWNADGKATVGFYRPSDGSWHLRDSHSGGASDHLFTFGPANMKPIVGDWNNDGKTTVGYYQPSNGTWHLRDTHSGGSSDHAFTFGPANMKPIAGDWNNS